jgi:TRAP-type C4-dicarboxylate transport system permease small subunit
MTMRSSLAVVVMVLLVVTFLAGCAPGFNLAKGTMNENGRVAGFWLGVWQGFIAPFVFVASLFRANLNIYEVHNNGAWYNFGYLFGVACFFGGGGNRSARRK